VETERDYIRITRLNEIYREELIEHRRRLGTSVDNLIGLTPSSLDPYSQPTHRRNQSSSSSVSTSPYLDPSSATHSARVPIPRPPSQIRRSHVHPNMSSTTTTPPSSSSASASLSSPFLFSPPSGGIHPSGGTSFTTPPSSASLNAMTAHAQLMNPHELTYPSVPPPSLSSSFGEPLIEQPTNRTNPNGNDIHQNPGGGTAPIALPRPIPRRDRDISVSPVDSFGSGAMSPINGRPGPTLSPRASFHIPRRQSSFERSGRHMMLSESPSSSAWMLDGFHGGSGNGNQPMGDVERRRSLGRGGGRGGSASVERGARVAETGRLVPKNSRAEIIMEDTSDSGVANGSGERGVPSEVQGHPEGELPSVRNKQDPT